VAEVYPELIVRDAEGVPLTVRYHSLPALLLNELQVARAQLTELAATVNELAAEVARLKKGESAARHDERP
jgi:cell division protein FtsB